MGSGPQTATTFCRLLRRFPPPPPPQRGQQCSREFLSVGSRHLAHYALVNAAVCWGGGGTGHPLVPVTHAMWAERGETASLQGGKKKVCGHARAKNLCRVFGLSEPSFTDVTSASCLSWLSANPAWRLLRRDHRQPSDDKSCSWLNSLEKRRRGIRAADECTLQESKRA